MCAHHAPIVVQILSVSLVYPYSSLNSGNVGISVFSSQLGNTGYESLHERTGTRNQLLAYTYVFLLCVLAILCSSSSSYTAVSNGTSSVRARGMYRRTVWLALRCDEGYATAFKFNGWREYITTQRGTL